MTETIKEIKDIAMTKFSRAKLTRDGVGGVELISSSTQASAGPPPDLRVPAGMRGIGSPGLLERPVWSAGDKASAQMSILLTAGVGTRSSGTMDGMSGSLQSYILELGGSGWDKSSCQGQVGGGGHVIYG